MSSTAYVIITLLLLVLAEFDNVISTTLDITVTSPQQKHQRLLYDEGESKENFKSAIKTGNTTQLSCKLTTMTLMV